MTNPLLQPSALPYALPPFAQVSVGHYRPAFEAGMAEQIAEIAAITADASPATFGNTIEALERSGRTLDRTTRMFYTLVASVADGELRTLETDYAPRLAAHEDAIKLDRALFARIDDVHAHRHGAGLTAEQVHLTERLHVEFVLAGARLDDDGAAELRQLNRAIAGLSTQFDQRLEAAMEAAAVVLDTEAELDGMSPAAIAGAAAAASARGHDGKYLLALVLPTAQPAAAVLTDRAVRHRLYRASVDRAVHGEHDTGPLAVDLAQLRARRAELLGFATHADLVTADQTAGSSAAVDDFLARLTGPALAALEAEAEILRPYAAADGVELQPWDWAFYTERARADRFAVDTAALRPFFELDRVVQDGVFYAATQLYGVTFSRREDLTGYHPDVQVWEVFEADGRPLGLFLADYYARTGKRGGAWMNALVPQSRLLSTRPVVLNNLNIDKPAPGKPTLLSLDETRTLFHEFGHALHGLLSDVVYPSASGTSVPTDFVEYPSQVNEMWMYDPAVVASYAHSIRTGAALDEATVANLEKSRGWGRGQRNAEVVAATLLDQAWHRLGSAEVVADAATFEEDALVEGGVASALLPPRYRSTYFHHIFGGGYSARYYAYLWSEVLDAETVDWFTGRGGLTRANGDDFRRLLLSVGGSVDALGAFRAVVGHDPDVGPLLDRLAGR